MDKITARFLKEFATNFELERLSESDQFEHFANYCVASKEATTIDIDIQDIHTGKATPGIDGILIRVNGRLVSSAQEVEDLIGTNNTLDVNFSFIQAKTSSEFDSAEISSFLTYTTSFFKEDKSIFATEEMKNFIDIAECIFNNSNYMKNNNPSLRLYYVSTGTWSEDDANLHTIMKMHEDTLKKLNLFSVVHTIPCGAAEIQKYYRKTKNEHEATVTSPKILTMFSAGDEIGYFGVFPLSEYKKIIVDEDGNLKPVFEENIRDFLGQDNDVNVGIADTLGSGNMNAFCMFNNGITIVADSALPSGDRLTIKNYQIVNGCQTSHVIYNSRGARDDILIPVRIITTLNEDIKNNITRATNNQTGIRKEQLDALSTFQKTLEEYYKAYDSEDERLYYERRTGQFRNQPIQNAKIVTIPQQIKSATSMFLNNPHGVSHRYGTIAKSVGTKIFRESDKPIMYYISSLALYRFEQLIKKGVIDKKYRKARYHVIMLLKYAIAGIPPKQHNSRKMEAYCKKIKTALNEERVYTHRFENILSFIDSYPQLRLDDRKMFERKETTDYYLSKLDELANYMT